MSEYFVDTLENGIRLVTVPMPHLHAAEVICYMAVGGQCESEELAGISHFLEHMIFRGTAEYPTSTDIERAFEAIGGAVNASTDAETTCFHSRLHPAYLEHGISLFASMLRRPLFTGIDVERLIILEEAREDYNEDGVQVNPDNLMASLLWPDHSLGKSLIGSPETLARITPEVLNAYYQRWYQPHNLVICACGPVAREALVAAAQNCFGDWAAASTSPYEQVPIAPVTAPQSCWVQDSDSQVVLQLAFRLPGRHDERVLALRFLCRLLAWGGGARLPLRLREELGLTYAVDAHCSLMDETGYLAVELSVAPKNICLAVRELLGVLDQLRQQPVPGDELDAAIRNYLFDLEFSQDQTEAQAVRYGWGLLSGYLRTSAQDRHDIQQLSAARLQQVATELLRRETLHLVVVGPWKEADRVKIEQLLQKF